jgi:glycosyltransferase involved in cell wall biosynthesis
MKISIIIPSYRETKEQLLETLFSIDTQKRVDFNDVEVIVVNDCGVPIYEDKTTTKFEHLQNIKVTYLHNTKNGGPLSAREYGFKHSIGDYVQFIDAEDSLIYSFYLETVFSIISDKHPDLIMAPHI